MTRVVSRKADHPLDHLWNGMKRRCDYPRSASFKNYGAKGIRVCNRWLVFENFVSDMGVRPPHATLERINSKGNYEPGNCRWATRTEQNENTSRNHYIEIDGENLTISQWSRRVGIQDRVLRNRLNHGWSDEDVVRRALTTNRNGSNNGQAKLVEADVLAIRASSLSNKDLATTYRISTQTIRDIRSRRTWSKI